MKSILKEVIIVIGAALVLATLSAYFHPKRPAWYLVADEDEKLWSIDKTRALELMTSGEVLWIDSRKASQFEQGHFPDAISLDIDNWGDTLFKHQYLLQDFINLPVIVYCDGTRCARSKEVAQRLRESWSMEQVYLLKAKWRDLVAESSTLNN